MDIEKLRNCLAKQCDKAGSQAQWARENRLSAAYVYDVITGRREPGKAILNALGFERVVTYRKAVGQKEG